MATSMAIKRRFSFNCDFLILSSFNSVPIVKLFLMLPYVSNSFINGFGFRNRDIFYLYNGGKNFNLKIKSLGQPDMNSSVTITAPALLQLVHFVPLHMSVNTSSNCY